MHDIHKSESASENLGIMVQSVGGMLTGEDDAISGLANVSSIINCYLGDINWAGFYLLKNGRLVLGPFQGLPACTRIELGKGVCGTAASRAESMVIDNVHEFEGHIACDGASNSEMVVPLFRGGSVCGVLDVDSPVFARFGSDEAEALNKVGKIVSDFLETVEL